MKRMKILKTNIGLCFIFFIVGCASDPGKKILGDFKHTENKSGLMKITTSAIICNTPFGAYSTEYLFKHIKGDTIILEVNNPQDMSDPNHPKNSTVIICLEPDGLSIIDNQFLNGHWQRM